ncbi:MAG: amidohydrolase [Chloroflexi bacterium]|nr:amidohydrolase [Chloroflexota bacterium]
MTQNPFLTRANELMDQIVAWRRQIHMHPELSFQEVETAKLVAESLAEMGIEAQTGVGKTGVVGYLGEGSPVIGIRADMDALPIQEANDVPYKSRKPGVMHACGHDAHTAILLGVAKMLSEMKDRPAGQIRFLFQPSEEASDSENKSGATRMIEDGALTGVDRVIALHVDSTLAAGKVEIDSGYVTAAEDSFHIVLKGTGGHGAMPHQGTDPTFMLAQVINAIQGIRSRRVDPTKGATISIGYIHAGTVTNVIPAEVKLGGTMRSFDDDVRELLKRELARACDVAKVLGGDYELRIVSGYPSTYNDPAVSEILRGAAVEMLGEEELVSPEPMMGAEDFSYMSRNAPGAMFMLGAKFDDKNRPHHTPVFDISEDALPVGAAVLADVTVRLLRGA